MSGKDPAPICTEFNRAATWDLLTRRFFFCQSFEIYGGEKGLFDYGPPGCDVEANILTLWRQHFILEDKMLALKGPSLTPAAVLRASGHEERFTDVMVKDDKGQFFRADTRIKEELNKRLAGTLKPEVQEEYETVLRTLDNLTCEQLGQKIKEYNIKSPENHDFVGEACTFNLMFGTQIGPEGHVRGYMRPETAQGIFVNFNRLLNYNGGRIPMTVAQIGTAFRNEIAPRAGLLRVREFTMCEIEHFVDPNNKSHPKFSRVAELPLNLYGREAQKAGRPAELVPLGRAVQEGLIGNETLAYFMARTHLFLLKIGIKPEFLRFRQHLDREMAHYASDCWDAEIKCSYGWIECVGHADRACYDLLAHQNATSTKHQAFEAFPTPIQQNVTTVTPNNAALGTKFRKDAGLVKQFLESMPVEEAEALYARLQADGKAVIRPAADKEFELAPNMLKVETKMTSIPGRHFTPHVIEPSFGVGRIMYCLFEHSFYAREGDAQRCVLAFNPAVAPVKCSVLPLSGSAELEAPCYKLSEALTALGVSNTIDESGAAIGRRYARTDEIGIPFALTVDFDTAKDDTVTLRERDSTLQIRAKIDDVAREVRRLVDGQTTWAELYAKYPHQAAPAAE
eukprot:gnl/Hemi2/10193_TR3527_c0_g18_i1.p2 gnl/Hemi2/10193_TR3527_c0_g18~~gnl/Hemi2/10193_TR3527_c0_g18_i1.p2  ORF type:complete len:624 (+),score=248.33 gnl/Hemi2/10193_TR3527_c0_g18_i1:159-2030(+)